MPRVSWLHFSDLHAGSSAEHNFYPNVEEKLLDDLEDLHEKVGRFDFLFFTGDLSNHGTEEHFRIARQRLTTIYKKLKTLGSEPVFLCVPGNHDVLRKKKPTKAIKHLLGDWKEDKKEFWKKDKNDEPKKEVLQSLECYKNWVRSNKFPKPKRTKKGPLPGDFFAEAETDHKVKIGVLGLNSTFLQLLPGNYEGKLEISMEQFVQCCGSQYARDLGKNHFCLLLTHHPPTWLSEESRKTFFQEIASQDRFAVHLFGHLHKGRYEAQKTMGYPASWGWQGHSLFSKVKFIDYSESKQPKEMDRKHIGYAAGTVDFEFGETVGELRVWPRECTETTRGFLFRVSKESANISTDGWSSIPETIPINVLPEDAVKGIEEKEESDTSAAIEYGSSEVPGGFIIVADISESTKMSNDERREALDKLWGFLRGYNPTTSLGWWVNPTPDGAIVGFRKEGFAYKQALEFAKQWRESLFPKVPVRFGIHRGDFEVREIDLPDGRTRRTTGVLIGGDINNCDRIASVGDPGQIVVSEEFAASHRSKEGNTINRLYYPNLGDAESSKGWSVKKGRHVVRLYKCDGDQEHAPERIATDQLAIRLIRSELERIINSIRPALEKLFPEGGNHGKHLDSVQPRVSLFAPGESSDGGLYLYCTEYRFSPNASGSEKGTTKYAIPPSTNAHEAQEFKPQGPLGLAYTHKEVHAVNKLPDPKKLWSEYVKILSGEPWFIPDKTIVEFQRCAQTFIGIPIGLHPHEPVGCLCIDFMDPLEEMEPEDLIKAGRDIQKGYGRLLAALWLIRVK